MKLGLPAVCLIAIFLHSNPVSAQSKQEDSVFYQSALAHTVSVYYNQLGDQAQIYNGSLYHGFDFTFREGSPYFLTEKTSKGSIEYDNALYPNQSLLYDDYRHNLIVVDQAFKLQLVNERISSFTIEGHHFDNLLLDSLNRGIPSAGFYEVLYAGRSKVLKRTYKKLREILSTTEGLSRYLDETDDYFIKSGNLFFPINTKREILNIMKDHRKEVQRFIRKNKSIYKMDRDYALNMVATYYDQLAK